MFGLEIGALDEVAGVEIMVGVSVRNVVTRIGPVTVVVELGRVGFFLAILCAWVTPTVTPTITPTATRAAITVANPLVVRYHGVCFALRPAIE